MGWNIGLKLKNLLLALCILPLGVACSTVWDAARFLSSPYAKPFFYTERTRMARHLYHASYGLYTNEDSLGWMQELLEAGADPDFCIGDTGWFDGNPLTIITFHYLIIAHYRVSYWGDLENDEDYPEIRALRLLLSYGADIHRRPYVWFRVQEYGNEFVNNDLGIHYWAVAKSVLPPPDDLYDPVTGKTNVELYQKHRQELWELADRLEAEDSGRDERFKQYVDAFNRTLKVLLEEGADPDQKGHPYPFTLDAWREGITDNRANRYFAKGTRAINEAIVKGMRWESQVDLLLQYTKLDEESLQAAKRSNDPKMVEKIEALWKKQQGTRLQSQ
jgi:hypothetical protein